MKKIIAIATASILGGVFSVDALAGSDISVCAGFSSASSVTVATGSFVKQSFSNKCSANVYLQYGDSDTDIGVCSGSTKGNFRFTGNSSAGAIVATGTKGTAAATSNTKSNSSGCTAA